MFLQSNPFEIPSFLQQNVISYQMLFYLTKIYIQALEHTYQQKFVHEVLLYTWKYQHALKLKLVHDDIKDGTIHVLQMIRTSQEYRKGRGFNETVSFWWIKALNKWRKILYPIYQQSPHYQGAC